ncbi:Glyoxalase-like domain protein [Tsuneonella dongtanensis]|uniref:Glyoxalase-like domain protein n=1 Tax=Tsuneonella dongtanensis TaxID=692370 RepID=A0A1B2AG23_9SPHN|nr:VOC family protein [Tsuneonella dongtanensis]ANY21086.1 Glyoxalase-like domain protein [Tsuneonella dongtanensis]
MRALLAALVLLAAAPALAQAAPAGGKSDGTVMRRTTLLVHDIDRSARFYEILGFAKWYVGKPGTVREGGLPVKGVKVGDPSRFIIMKGKDPYLGMIGLLQYGPKRKPAKFALRVGDPVLMIEIAGMDRVAATLAAEGFAIHKAPETTRVESVGSAWDAKFMFAIDPDGHMLELTERLN